MKEEDGRVQIRRGGFLDLYLLTLGKLEKKRHEPTDLSCRMGKL